MYLTSKLKCVLRWTRSRFRPLASVLLAALLLASSPFFARANTFDGESADYTVGKDTEPLGSSGGNAYPFYGVQLTDGDGNPLPMPRTFPAIIEGPMWNNPLGKCPYFFVTFNGKIAYCIEPFVFNTSSGVNYEQRKEFSGLTADQRKTVSYLLKFGSPSGNDSNNNWHAATQCLIWEVTSGQRQPDMTGSPGSYYNALVQTFPGMTAKYNQMIEQVKSWRQIPSFTNQIIDSAPTYKLEGSGPYTVTLTNTNSACNLSSFGFQATGVTCTVNGNDLVITSPTEITGEVTVKGDRTDVTDSSDNYIFWCDPAGKDQTRMSPGPDPVPCYFKLGTEASGPMDPGTPDPPPGGNYQITINKLETGTDAPLSGAQFEIRFLGGPGDIIVPPANPEGPPVIEPEHQFVSTATTNASGKITISVPYKGVYKITEQVPPANHKLAEQTVQTVTLNDGSPSAQVSYHNEPYTGITIQKIDAQTKAPLSGATFQLEQIDGDIVKTGITGANGKLTFSDIPAGSYRVTETAPPPNYHLSKTPSQSVELKHDQMASLVFENEPYSGLRIRKVDAETGEGLSGALFSIHVKDGELVGEALTDVNGLVIHENLPEGWYTVTEKQPPEGYLLDTPSRDVYVRPEEDVEVVFRDFKRPELLLKKEDAKTGAPLPGAVFRVARRDSAEYTEVTTGSDGTVLLTGLDADWYTVTEIKAPEGYILDSMPRDIQLLPGKTSRIVIDNNARPSLKLRKIDSLTKQPLAHAEFRIQEKNGKILGTYRTNEDGVIFLEDIAPALYVLTETNPPAGYLPLADPIEALVEPNQVTTVTLENTPRLPLLIHKLDSATGDALEGAVFAVTKANGEAVGEYKTGRNGYAVVPELEPGFYTIKEVKAPEGYLLSGTPQTVELREGKPAQVEFTNTRKESLQILKVDAETGDPLPGAVFTISKTSGEPVGDRYTTDRNGSILLSELEPGAYIVTEVQAPEGYILSAAPQTVELKPGQSARLEFTNTKKSRLELRKLDGATRLPMDGVTFRLSGMDGGFIGNFRTQKGGQILIDNLAPGWYTLREIETLPGYLLDDSAHNIELKAGETASLELLNQPLNSLTIRKKDALTGLPLAGVEFRLETVAGTFVGDYITGEDGNFTVTNLEPGWYRACETKTLSGYKLDKTPQTVELVSGKTAELVFTNQPLNTLIVKKIDAVTKRPLVGVRMQVNTARGEKIGEYVTKEGGYFAVNDLAPGSYTVFELETMPDYVLDPTPQTVELAEGHNAELTFTNRPRNTLEVRKTDAVTGKPLTGVRFEVTKLNGEKVGIYTTANGQAVVTGLEPGVYVVRETQTIPGYVLDATPQTVELLPGKSAVVEFTNIPLVGLQIRKVDSITGAGIGGVGFDVKQIDGRLIGSFLTDSSGYIYIPGLQEGWIEVVETKPASGYKPDPTPRKIEIRADQLNLLRIENQPWPVLEIRKTDRDSGEPIGGVKLKLSDALGRELGTYITNSMGKIVLTGMEAGNYFVQEAEAAEGYLLDSSVKEATLEWGRTAIVEFTNQRLSTLRIRKVDAETGKPIYGTAFLLYDFKGNLLGEFTTNQNGEIVLPRELPPGRYKLKEIQAAPGYVLDDRLHTVELKSGETTEVVIQNEPVRGRIQILKKSAEYNDITKLKKGSPLSGAVFEIFDRSNTVVAQITTDRRGIATSPPLSLGVYGIREIAAPAGYQLNDTVFFGEIKLHEDLLQFEVLDENEELRVTVEKYGNIEAMPGDIIQYDFKHIGNASSVELEDFYFHDRFPTDGLRLEKLKTGTWSEKLTYQVLYKTNLRDYRILADNLDSKINHTLDCGREALGLRGNEYITDIKFAFGTVQPGFEEVKSPVFYCAVNANLPNQYRFTNCADTGGKRKDDWILAKDCWTTIVYSKPRGRLPQTGL